MSFLNIAAYQFSHIEPHKLPSMRDDLKQYTRSHELKGTILISPEGINLFMAGKADAIRDFQSYLARNYPIFNDLYYKNSYSADQPFSRMLVKIKKEIIAFGQDTVKPEQHTPAHISPQQLHTWYQEGKDMVILDTRNDYEVELGLFQDAVDLNIKSFRDFPEAVEKLANYKDKTVVTYCTGGIRCEKAAEYMQQQGFDEVVQLEGGILNYFEQYGNDYYQGECFVFDKRVAVDSELKETKTIQCYACRNPLRLDQQHQSHGICPYCGDTALAERQDCELLTAEE